MTTGRWLFGPILFTIIVIIGHALNIGINALGAYVHTNRLQYVSSLENSTKVAVKYLNLSELIQNIIKLRRVENMEVLNSYGIVLALIGAVLSALIPGMASAKGVTWAVLPVPELLPKILHNLVRYLFFSFFRNSGYLWTLDCLYYLISNWCSRWKQ